ncbi:MAG: Killer protein [Gammaproteobacteria bacterium]|nr:MAG: Killer protein [Gammaproteobacteria bacterium]UTW43466.1 type II toxin-antitoxin system RelE/ParE family toxin [bacterium SCSIO 12844]
MIKSFKHKGLKLFFETGNTKGIQAKHASKLRRILATLNAAVLLEDISNIPSYKFHELKGNRKNQYSIMVSGNWRITFEFESGNVYLTNYEDYH